MLRAIVVVLLIANALVLAWALGWLRFLGPLPDQIGREPERLSKQIKPEVVQYMPPVSTPLVGNTNMPPADTAETAASAVEAPASDVAPAPSGATENSAASSAQVAAVSASCLEVGPFTTLDLPIVERTLTRVDANKAWVQRPVESDKSWYVYLGPFEKRPDVTKKRAELTAQNIKFELTPIDDPALALAIPLGRYSSEVGAKERMMEIQKLGVKDAKVTTTTKTRYFYRYPSPDEALQNRLTNIRQGLGGYVFGACSRS